MTLPRISGKALWKIIENAGINPKWVQSINYDVSKKPVMTLTMLAVVDDKLQLNENRNGILKEEIELDVCNCGDDCGKVPAITERDIFTQYGVGGVALLVKSLQASLDHYGEVTSKQP